MRRYRNEVEAVKKKRRLRVFAKWRRKFEGSDVGFGDMVKNRCKFYHSLLLFLRPFFEHV